MPVDSKLQAAIAAQVIIRTSRLDYETAPKVISVEEMTLAEAQKIVRQLKPGNTYHDDIAGDTKVWLVMLKGEYRIIPPDPEHTYTPEPLAEGCISVIVDQDGRSELMAAACAE